MATVILDQHLAQSLIAERKRLGQDRYDEVWEGVYMMAPAPNDEHSLILMRLSHFFDDVIGIPGLGDVRSAINVSNRAIGWEKNFRVPDLAVMLLGGKALNRGSYWQGGPDFVVEVCSPDEDPHEKIGFYGAVGVREMLVIDRDPWKIELFRMTSDRLTLVSECTPASGAVVSEVIPFDFRLEKAEERPILVVSHRGSSEIRRI